MKGHRENLYRKEKYKYDTFEGHFESGAIV